MPLDRGDAKEPCVFSYESTLRSLPGLKPRLQLSLLQNELKIILIRYHNPFCCEEGDSGSNNRIEAKT